MIQELNYPASLYGYLGSAQLEHYYPQMEISKLKDNFLKYGNSKPFNDLLLSATGETLNPEYLIETFEPLFSSRKFTNENRRRISGLSEE